MNKVDLLKETRPKKRKIKFDTPIVEAVCYIGGAVYYVCAFICLITVILAGWKYILS